MTTLLEQLGVTDIRDTSPNVPVQRDNVLYEFIPDRDDAIVTKLGNPILRADRRGYDVGIGDALVIPRDICRRAFQSPAGFTFMMVFGWDATADVDQHGTFECCDADGNDSVYGNAARAGDDDLLAVSCGLAWNPGEYQGRQHDANIACGSHIVSLRFNRTDPIPSRTRCGLDGSILFDERINAYGPNEPYSDDVLNGPIVFYGSSHFYVGSRITPNPGKTVPRIGYFALWDTPLSDAEWRYSMLFGLAQHFI